MSTSKGNGPIPLFLKGLFMGTADVIPGISGGTIALVVGIYSELIDSIKNISLKNTWQFISAVLLVWNRSKWAKIKSTGAALNLGFLLPLTIGIATAIILASKWIPDFIRDMPQESNALFFGLILASIYVPYSKIESSKILHFLILIVSAMAFYQIVGLSQLQSAHGLGRLFSTGAVAVCALILPGISGAYILKIMGEYAYILDTLHSALKFNWEAIGIVLVFISGMALGLALFSRILSYLLHNYLSLTMAILAGIMLGALRSVWPYQAASGINFLPTSLVGSDLTVLLYFGLGMAVTSALIYFDRAMGKE